MDTRFVVAALIVVGVTSVGEIGLTKQASDTALYQCVDSTESEAMPAGTTLCTAEPTETLTARAETENLQVRSGALVVDVEAGGIAAIAGLAVDDLIYRVGSVDVNEASAATERLGTLGTNADTIVNFLRRGRPYRVKLRR